MLAGEVAHLRDASPLVLGLPRGGVPVAAEIAQSLDAELDAWIVRKVGAPGFEEFGVGAVAEGGEVYLNRRSLARVGLEGDALEEAVERRAAQVAQRALELRGPTRNPPRIAGRTVLVVDDGIATGGSMLAALQSLRAQRPQRLIVAVPVSSTQALEQIEPLVDEVITLVATPDLNAVGAWYDDFGQTGTEEVRTLLQQAWARPRKSRSSERVFREVTIPVGADALDAILDIPPHAKALVIFAHGSGSNHLSPRNAQVASALQRHGLATLRVSLLTPHEARRDAQDASFRFDLDLLEERLGATLDWSATSTSGVAGLKRGLFGSSTGAAAALEVAADRPTEVGAVVSRGGRVDLAEEVLPRVRAPTLFLVGARDSQVLELNRRALRHMGALHVLSIVPGANHLFEEPGALELVCEEAARWFIRHLLPETSELRADGEAPTIGG